MSDKFPELPPALPKTEYQLWIGDVLIGNVSNSPQGWQFEPRCTGAYSISILAGNLYTNYYRCISGVAKLFPALIRGYLTIWKMENGQRIETALYNPQLDI